MYKLLNDNLITGESATHVYKVDTNTYVAISDSNPMYQEYLAWLAEGNEPLPADEPTQRTI